MDGTARLLQLANKRVLATLVHCEPKALDEQGGAAASATATATAASDEEGEGMDMDERGEEGEVREEASYSVETVGFSHVFNWCATGEFDPQLIVRHTPCVARLDLRGE